MNKCPTCKPILSKTIVCPESVPCPNPTPCSEILDAACFQYEGSGISLCNINVQIVQTFDSLELALQKIIDSFCTTCNLVIDIIPGELPSLAATVTGGTGPYTYKWSIAQVPFVGHTINGSTTSSSVLLECIPANGIETETFNSYMKITNIYLTVSDTKGCVSTAYYYYTSDCYPILLAPPIPVLPEIPSQLYAKKFESPLALQVMNFMDYADYIPTCQELKDICCDIDGMTYDDAAEFYRASRDCYLKALNENGLGERAGNAAHNVLNYNTWLPGGLNEQLIFEKAGLMNYQWLWGCPECTLALWNEFYYYCLTQVTSVEIINTGMDILDGIYNNIKFSTSSGSGVDGPGLYFTANLTVVGNIVTSIVIVKKGSGYVIDEQLTPLPGQLIDNGAGIVLPVFKVKTIKNNRVVDILPTVNTNIVYLPMVIHPDPFPTTIGNPGETFKYIDFFGSAIYYAWDPIMQLWNQKLGDCVFDSLTAETRAKRDAYLKALSEMILAHAPFMSANEYFPFHRWRNEIF
jgi:hypothetical protein